MATKWKKSKAVCGFLSFALGVSLLLCSLLPILGNLVSASGRERLKNALKSDFQNTPIFRDYLSNTMNGFIAMGAGGPIGGSYYGTYDYGGGIASDTLMETTIIQAAENEVYFGGDPYAGYEPTKADRERWKKDAETWAKQFEKDKNILYYITVDGRVAYTNMEQPENGVPVFPAQGYGFRLSFDGSKCEAVKGEARLDLYGNGYYAEDGKHWSLPGYSNYPAGEEAKGVRVHLAVADEPALYIKANYSSGWSWGQNYNRYYWHYQNWQKNRQVLGVRTAVLLSLGLLFMAGWFLLRREKPLADRAIARATGHIWFEIKLLLLLGAGVLLLLPLTEEMRYLLTELTYAISIEDGGYYPTGYLGQYLCEILRQPGTVLAAFWACWLFVNDLRYGDKPWRHGICGMLTARSLKLPIQKRLSRRAVALTAVLLVLGGYICLFIPVLGFNFPQGVSFFLPPVLALLLGLSLAIGPRQRRLWCDIGSLTEQIAAVHDGDLTSPLSLPADSDLGRASQEVADIQQGMAQAVDERTRSERMKVELVTNVSHDIKTPLTSIISYAELLKQEQLPPPAKDYVEILCQKSERLRDMVLDVFEISKAASGELPVKLEELDLAKLLRQTTADMAQAIQAAPVTLRQAIPEEPVTIVADGQRLYRVFQNLIQNALQYALEGSRVYLTLEVAGGKATASLKNTSKTELPEGVDFTARFVRGDESRTDGGSGLGLAIADSFTAACGGVLEVSPIADLFVVTVCFPLAP